MSQETRVATACEKMLDISQQRNANQSYFTPTGMSGIKKSDNTSAAKEIG